MNYRTDKFLVHEENALVCFVTWPGFSVKSQEVSDFVRGCCTLL